MKQQDPITKGHGARVLLGALVALASLAGMLWIGIIFTAEYRFRTIAAPSNDTIDKAFLLNYADRLQHLLQLDPTNGEIRNNYASVLALLGDSERAIRHPALAQADYQRATDNMRRAMKTHNTQTSRYFLADMYEKMGDLKNAELMLRECLLLNPIDYKFNAAQLRLLNKRLLDLKSVREKGGRVDGGDYDQAQREFAQAATNWFIRAPHDMNSYLFMGNSYIDPLYPLQAYRIYLMGLSLPHWMALNPKPLIELQGVLRTIHQIIEGHYAKPYKDLRW